MKKAFITGASGYIGFEVASEFHRNGYAVTGLVRGDAAARKLAREEIRPVLGSFQEMDAWLHEARTADIIIHAGVDHHAAESLDLERDVVAALLQAARQKNAVFIYSSGVWVVGDTQGEWADENSLPNPTSVIRPRLAIEQMVLDAMGARGMVIRPGVVYGKSSRLLGSWFRGESIVEGDNCWAMVHVTDLARAYRLLAEHGNAGEVINIVDGRFTPVRELAHKARVVAGFDSVPVSIPLEQARASMGALADALALDQRISNERACQLLGWQPLQPAFGDEVQRYFQAWRAATATS